MSSDAGPARSRAALIGVAAYDDASFTPVPAARNSLAGMRALLTDPALCGWPDGDVSVIEDPRQPGRLARQIRELGRDAAGVLLVYYAGHGQLTARGELCLTVTDTVATDPDYTGVPFGWIRDALRESPARVKVIILDCCYAGQAIEALGQPDGIPDLTHVKGAYTLTATARNRTAHVSPPGEQDAACTSFTAELIALARSGIPGGPAGLTLSALYPHLRRRLAASGLPEPSQRGTDTADRYVFTRNAWRPGSREPSAEAAARRDRGDTRHDDHQPTRAEETGREETRPGAPDPGGQATIGDTGRDPQGPSRPRWRRLLAAITTLALIVAVTTGLLLYVQPGRNPSGPRRPAASPPARKAAKSSPAGKAAEPSASGRPATAAGAAQPPAAMPPGYVTLGSLATGNCFDSTDSGSVFTFTCNGGSSQEWSALRISGAIYALKNKLTGFCLTGSTQTGIYSTTCDTSDPHQQWLWNESDSSASFVHLSNGHCLAEPAPDQPTTVECDGSTDQHWRIG
jgi:hypothetical protein